MMGLHSNLNKVIERFHIITVKSKEVDFSQALLAGVNAAKAKMQFRIFNKGLDAVDRPFGKYRGRKDAKLSEVPGLFDRVTAKKDFLIGSRRNISSLFSPYELKRLKAGRQIAFKDLEFSGALRRAIIVVRRNQGKVDCVIVNPEAINKADNQEMQIAQLKGIKGRVPIFRLSKSERELMIKNIQAIIKQLYDRHLKP